MSDHSKRLKLKGRVLVLGAFIGAALFATSNFNPLKAAGPIAQTTSGYTEFESGQVRPIAMSPDKTKLFAVNTPNNTLEIFNITSAGLALQARVPVGMEPVAVTPRDDNEVWSSIIYRTA
jgi:hypothetical protein